MAKWDTVMKLRQDVNGTLEIARSEKRIGKALEAHVTLAAADGIPVVCAASDQPFAFTAGYDSQEALTAAAHAWELTPADTCILCLDADQSGIGSNSCGPQLQDAYRLDGAALHACWTLTLGTRAAQQKGAEP